jgi:uncharacterized membrane protein
MSSRFQSVCIQALITWIITASVTPAAPPRYTAVPVYDSSLAGFPRPLEYREDVNGQNQVLGRTLVTSSHAVWDRGQMRNLTTPAGHTAIYAYRLNDSGHVLFAGLNPGGTGAVWVNVPNDTQYTFLHSPTPNWHYSLPYRWGITRSGEVLGTARDSVTLFNGGIVWRDRAAMWSPSGSGYLLGLPDELRDSAEVGSFRNSWAAAVSDGGALVIKARGLYGSPATLIERHYLHQGAGWAPILPLTGWENLRVTAVSDAGHVTGDMRDPGSSSSDPHAFMWQGGQITDLHRHSFTLSAASDVNRRGHVVGTYYDEVYQGGNYPITVPRTGFVFRDGEMYLFNDVVTGGFSTPSVAVAVNEAGVILVAAGNSFQFTFLLVPSDTAEYSLHVVNSTDDDGDADLTDGLCSTGWQLQNGVDECTFRASLEQSNFTADQDTILFALPANDLTIEPHSSLPAISQPVWISGTSAGSRVVLAGGSVGDDSLLLAAEGSTVRSMVFEGFSRPALVLGGAGRHTVMSCEFGRDPDSGGQENGHFGLVVHSVGNTVGGRFAGEGNVFHFNHLGGLELRGDSTTVWGNRIEKNGYASGSGDPVYDRAHGVTIYGSHNVLGDYFWEQAGNTIRNNGGAGILVEAGEGNDFRYNVIHGNGGLAIDLAPVGVNPQDSLDLDSGPNTGVNSPRFDSISVNGSPTAHFTILGEPQYGYMIEVFESDSCDCQGYGGGQRRVATHQVVGDATGRAYLSIPIADTTRVYSLTATRDDHSTSEFSRCLVEKFLQHFDIDSRLQHDTLTLYRVTGWMELPLDTVETDDSGRVDLKPYLLDGRLGFQDTVKVSKHVFAQANLKGSSDLFGTRSNLTIDNMRINDTTGEIRWDTLTADRVQDVYLERSLFSYNLLVSIEWDVDGRVPGSGYLSQAQESMHDLSTYLFDVYDGQVRLDTVVLGGNRYRWRDADVRIFAQNDLEPSSAAFSLFAQDRAVNMSRRWFGAASLSPDLSLSEYPADPSQPEHYRALGRELGRYLHGLQYEDGTLNSCAPDINFGMMDNPLPSVGESATELSWARTYASGCTASEQYRAHGMPCWEWVEGLLERQYGETRVGIRTPGERALPAGADWLSGPSMYREVELDLHSGPRAAHDMLLDIQDRVPGQAARYADVTLRKAAGPSVYDMAQGKAAHDGRMWVLGVEAGDSIIVQSRASGGGSLAASPAAASYSWYFAKAEVTGDSLELQMSQVQGDYPVVLSLITGTPTEVRLSSPSVFAQAPDLSWVDSLGTRHTNAFAAAGAGEFAVSLDIPQNGLTAYVSAVDDSGRTFFFPVDLNRALHEATDPIWHINNVRGDLTLLLDSAGNNLAQVLTASTSFPAPTTGTLDGCVLAGRVHAIGLEASVSLSGEPLIGIGYSDSDLVLPGATYTLEQTLRVYRWEQATSQWRLVGGVPDTSGNVVWTILPGAGTYALFTQDQVASVEEPAAGTLPDGFSLAQNYPNPFNPATRIAFTLPQAARVTVDVLNILGQRVIRLTDSEPRSAGRHEVEWDGRSESGRRVASGPYLYRIQAGDQVQTRKMLLLK